MTVGCAPSRSAADRRVPDSIGTARPVTGIWETDPGAQCRDRAAARGLTHQRIVPVGNAQRGLAKLVDRPVSEGTAPPRTAVSPWSVRISTGVAADNTVCFWTWLRIGAMHFAVRIQTMANEIPSDSLLLQPCWSLARRYDVKTNPHERWKDFLTP